MKDLSIVIVNYNSGELTNQCINSINETVKEVNYEIIVVDNASPDESGKKIDKQKVNFIQLENNIGFSGGNNVGICEATGKYILLLNPDTIVLENTIDEIFKYYEKSGIGIGAIGCKIVNKKGLLDKGCKRSFPTLVNSISHFSKLDSIFSKSKLFGGYNLTYVDENSMAQVECISGAFMFINSEVINKIGSLDERFFMHAEDIDLCYRMHKEGYKILYYPAVSIVHLKGESSKTSNDLVVKYFFESMWIFYEKNYYSDNNIIINYTVKIGIKVLKNTIILKNKIVNRIFR